MEGARIFKLTSPLTVTSSNFEESFGDYSEASGRGRAKRAARRAARRENKMARIASRGEARSARRANKQAAVEDRQTRRQTRVSGRIGRRQLRDEFRKSREEAETPETQENETVNPTPDTGGTGFGVSDGTAYTNDTQGGGSGYMPEEPQGQSQEPAMGESETTEESDIEAGENEASGEDEEGSGADGINYEDLGPVEDIVTLEPDDFYTYDDDSANADGTPSMVRARIGKGPKDVAMKCEWNKEMVSRLKDKLASIDAKLSEGVSANQAASLGAKRAKINEAIVLHTDRAQGFDGMLSDYMNADDYSEASGRKPKKTVKKKRKAEVKAAKREARKARLKSKKQAKSIKRMERKGLQGDSVIPVEEQLKPEFDTQRIVVPAADLTTGADGRTGLIALDDANDFDSPMQYSNASGPMKNINWKGVLIGVGIAGLAIWGAKKAKLF